jgi:PKD repeat protein
MKHNHPIYIAAAIIILSFAGCQEPEPIASFFPSTFSARVDELITFTNTSQNATLYNWSFGDGSISTDESPSHVYASTGEFIVQLTASGVGGLNSVSSTIAITSPEPVVEFTMDKASAMTGEAIRFINKTLYADSYVWSFGDGNSTTAESPIYSYSTTGTFVITLTATGDGGTASTTAIIQIGEALFNIIPGVRMGSFVLGNDIEQHFAYVIDETYGYFGDSLEDGLYIHWFEFDTTGIGFILVSDSFNVYYSDVPGGIYAFDPFVGNTEQEITFGSTLAEVESAYGPPDGISESGSYSYVPSLGISFWADTSKTLVSEIFIEEPTGTSKSSPVNGIRQQRPKATSDRQKAIWRE